MFTWFSACTAAFYDDIPYVQVYSLFYLSLIKIYLGAPLEELFYLQNRYYTEVYGIYAQLDE